MNKKERGRRNRRRIITKAVVKMIVGVLLIQLLPIIMFVSLINDNYCATEENTYTVGGIVDDAWVHDTFSRRNSKYIYFEIDGERYRFHDKCIKCSFEETAEMLKREGKVDVIIKEEYNFLYPPTAIDVRSDDKVYADIEKYNTSMVDAKLMTKIAFPFVWLITIFISLLYISLQWDVIKAHLVKKKKNKNPLG